MYKKIAQKKGAPAKTIAIASFIIIVIFIL